jgi:ArsR family transcriptional regulator, arsenate/arsenite/antimonite-responsive transcriptional repressor
MDLVRIYECLCDRTRLRILSLLAGGPLCVCQVQAALAEPQVKISKHLGYLKRNGMVEAERRGNWMIYRLPRRRAPALRANLACLQDCAAEDPIFRRDQARLVRLAPTVSGASAGGCERERAEGSPTRSRSRPRLF